MSSPLVSVIMPAYNAGRYISEAIQSVIDQDYSNFELLIINDGSTDNTQAIIDDFSDSRIRCFRQENKGVSSARNLGLDNMQGDFFCFLDADDVLLKKGISARLRLIKDDINVIMGAREERSANLLETIKTHTPPDSNKNLTKRVALLQSEVFYGCVPFLIRTEGFKMRFQEGWSHCEDLAFCLEIYNEPMAFTNTVIQYYRRNNDSAMTDLNGLAQGYKRFSVFVKEKKILTRSELLTVQWKIFRIMGATLLAKKKFKLFLKWMPRYFQI